MTHLFYLQQEHPKRLHWTNVHHRESATPGTSPCLLWSVHTNCVLTHCLFWYVGFLTGSHVSHNAVTMFSEMASVDTKITAHRHPWGAELPNQHTATPGGESRKSYQFYNASKKCSHICTKTIKLFICTEKFQRLQSKTFLKSLLSLIYKETTTETCSLFDFQFIHKKWMQRLRNVNMRLIATFKSSICFSSLSQLLVGEKCLCNGRKWQDMLYSSL